MYLRLAHLSWLSWISLQRRLSCSVRLRVLSHRSSRAPPAWPTLAANSGSACSTFRWSRSSPKAALLSSRRTSACWVRKWNQQWLCWVYIKLRQKCTINNSNNNRGSLSNVQNTLILADKHVPYVCVYLAGGLSVLCWTAVVSLWFPAADEGFKVI